MMTMNLRKRFLSWCLAALAGLLLTGATTVVVVVQPTSTATCPDWGTYLGAWNGDYPSDTDKACWASGTLDGTLSGGTLSTDHGESGSVGFGQSDADHYLEWTIANGDFPETDSTGFTIYLRIRLGESDGADAQTIFFELENDADATDRFYGVITSDERFEFYWRGNNDVENIGSGAGTILRDGSTWYTVGVTMIPGEDTAANDRGWTINGGTNWTESSSAPTVMTGQINRFSLGNRHVTSANDPISIDKFVIISGYKQSCPW